MCMWSNSSSSSSSRSSSRISISILQFWQLPGGTVSPTVCHPFPSRRCPSLTDCLPDCPSLSLASSASLSVGRAVFHIMAAGRQSAFRISHSEAQTNAKAFLSLLPLINSLANRFAQLFPSPSPFPLTLRENSGNSVCIFDLITVAYDSIIQASSSFDIFAVNH